LEAAKVCPHVDFTVVTDRECPVEEACRTLGIPVARIVESDRGAFSRQANRVFNQAGGCDAVIMLFARLVTAPLTASQHLLNIHPSLLPAFRGFGAVAAAHASGVKFFGTTLHVATEQMDAGPILAQACQPVRPSLTIAQLEHLSFLQKTALFLLAIELLESGSIVWKETCVHLAPDLVASDRLNPMLTNGDYIAAVHKLQRQGLEFLRAPAITFERQIH
jgi:phosphoribosylglycinamide formyltransferase-1